MGARANLPDRIAMMIRSELEHAIYEANLGEDDTLIAKRYLIGRVAQIDIAVEIGCERSTVSRRLKSHILPRILATAERLK